MHHKGFSVTGEGAPRLWVLASPHAGDNTQLRALANALGWPMDWKTLAYAAREEFIRPLGLATLAGLDRQKSSPLAAPWPDAVLMAGRGAESVAFWLKRHANPQLKTVFVGTPWASPKNFDLVIATPQYALPDAANILQLGLPIHGVTPELLAEAAQRLAPRLAHLPRPFTAVLLGGSSGPYAFTAEAARRLARQASDMAKAKGGSLLVTTSARTPADVTEALTAGITAPAHVHRWVRGDAENPFHGFLALADDIVVTADSISMLSEAAATGKPVFLFDIEEGPYAMRASPAGQPIHWKGRSFGRSMFRLLINHAPPRFSRDLRIVQARAVDDGIAAWMGEEPKPRCAAPEDGLSLAVTRIRALFGL